MLLNKIQKTSSIILIVSILATIGCGEPAPEPDAATYIANGDTLFNDGRNIDAIKEYTKAIELNPNLESAYIKRAVSNSVHLHRYDEAIKDYTKAIQINPNSEIAYTSRALNYVDLENYQLKMEGKTPNPENLKLALKDCEKALQINPNNIQAHHIMGTAHYGRGEYQQAIDKYNEALEIDPNYGPANFGKEIAERMKIEDDQK